MAKNTANMSAEDLSYYYNRKVKRKNQISSIIRYTVLIVVGIFMVYPLLWMVGATFKENSEIFAGLNIIPRHPTLEGYQNAVKSYGGNINITSAKSCLHSNDGILARVNSFECYTEMLRMMLTELS